MRNAAPPGPAGVLQHRQRPLVLAQPVGQRAVELQPVAVRPHAAIADQIARILVAEQVLAGRHRRRDRTRPAPPAADSPADRRLPRTRTADSRAASWRRRSPSSRSKRPLASTASALRCRSPPAPPRCGGDPRRAFRRRSSSSPRCSRDRDSCASRRTAPHRPCRDSSSRRRHRRRRADRPAMPCRSASRRNSGLPAIFATASHTAMSIVPTATERSPWPPGFSLRHQAGPDAVRIEIFAAVVEQRARVRLQQARREALADQAALAVAAIRVEAVADHASVRRAPRSSPPRRGSRSSWRSRCRRCGSAS